MGWTKETQIADGESKKDCKPRILLIYIVVNTNNTFNLLPFI